MDLKGYLVRAMKKLNPLYPVPFSECNLPPTLSMLETLKMCAKLENDFPGRPYGPLDIHRTFNGLYNRGMLDMREVKRQKDGFTWFVTSEGFQYLLSKCSYQG
jgi:hypothetical protein